MQNGIYKEGWLEFSNRFSMNLTKVLFVAFIFLFALSFAAATGETETPAGTEAATADEDKLKETKQKLPEANVLVETESETKRGTGRAATHFKERVSQLPPVVLCSVLLLWACFGLVLVCPKPSAMVWMMTKLPTLCFEVPQEASEDIKKGYLYQIFEWVYVSYKGYSLIFEVGLVFVFGVFLFAKNIRLFARYCAYPILEYGILVVLFVWIDISSYLRWEVPVPIEEGRNVSKTVKVSDYMSHVLIFGFALIRLVSSELIFLNTDFQKRSLNRVQLVFLPLWNSVASVLSVLYIVMLGPTVIYHHPFVDVIATAIVFLGIYVPISIIIDIVIKESIFTRIVRSLLQPKAKPSETTTEKLPTRSTKRRPAGKINSDETKLLKTVV